MATVPFHFPYFRNRWDVEFFDLTLNLLSGMENNFDSLKRFFEKVRSIGLFERIFQWATVRRLLLDAGIDLQKAITTLEFQKAENSKNETRLSVEEVTVANLQESVRRIATENEILKNTLAQKDERLESLQKEIAATTATNSQYLRRGNELANELASLKPKIENLEKELREIRDENLRFKKDDEHRMQDHSRFITSVTELREKVESERRAEVEERNNLELARVRKLKETWSTHEDNVRGRIKAICSKHGIDYVTSVPFKGKPDNTLKIKDEYIIFDAKSPAGDDLSNFSSYLKNQVETVSKYVREEDVRKEVFLVIPTNTLDQLEQFEYKLADYDVFIISLDSLEPVILALKKIEEYEFAEQLSPEERENICRVIGKFIHLSKRRIQIDGFFAKQFFELAYRSEAELPKDILDKVVEFERSEKLNPPTEKRARQISTKELENDSEKLKNEATQKGILTQDSVLTRELNKLPLYSTASDAALHKDQGQLFEP